MLYCVLPIQLLFAVKSTYYIRALSILTINCLNNYDSYVRTMYVTMHWMMHWTLVRAQRADSQIRYDTKIQATAGRSTFCCTSYSYTDVQSLLLLYTCKVVHYVNVRYSNCIIYRKPVYSTGCCLYCNQLHSMCSSVSALVRPRTCLCMGGERSLGFNLGGESQNLKLCLAIIADLLPNLRCICSLQQPVTRCIGGLQQPVTHCTLSS